MDLWKKAGATRPAKFKRGRQATDPIIFIGIVVVALVFLGLVIKNSSQQAAGRNKPAGASAQRKVIGKDKLIEVIGSVTYTKGAGYTLLADNGKNYYLGDMDENYPDDVRGQLISASTGLGQEVAVRITGKLEMRLVKNVTGKKKQAEFLKIVDIKTVSVKAAQYHLDKFGGNPTGPDVIAPKNSFNNGVPGPTTFV